MSLAILFHFFCAQHVSDISISIFRSLRLCWWITTSVVLFSARAPPETNRTKIFNTQPTENKTTDVVIQQHSRKLLKMDILMFETCWAHKKWNKIASDIKLVFHSSTITMMHGPINIKLLSLDSIFLSNGCTSLYSGQDVGWTTGRPFRASGAGGRIFLQVAHTVETGCVLCFLLHYGLGRLSLQKCCGWAGKVTSTSWWSAAHLRPTLHASTW